mgnify:CR=1 FL=1
MNIKDLAKKYELKREDFWELHGNWILTHDAVTRVATKEQIELVGIESIYQTDTICRFLVTMSKAGHKVTSVGEADNKTSRNPYYGCMAEKRGIDRCVLKLIRAYEYGIKSEIEADDFRRDNG